MASVPPRSLRSYIVPIGATVLVVIIAAIVLIATSSGDDGGKAAASTSTLDRVKSSGVLRAGIRTDFPPHSYLNGKQQWVGFDVDIAKAVAQHLGVKLEKVKVDELTRISYLQDGKIDLAAASMNHTWEREAQVDFSETYFYSYQTFLVRENGGIRTLHDIVGKVVGFSRGGSPIGNWRDWLKAHGYPPAKYVEFSDKQAAIQAVKQGTIAGYGEDYEAVKSFANANPGLTVLTGQSIGIKQDGLGVPENDSKWRDAVNEALQAVWTSGEYRKIYLRWFGPDSSVPIWPMRGKIEVWPQG